MGNLAQLGGGVTAAPRAQNPRLQAQTGNMQPRLKDHHAPRMQLGNRATRIQVARCTNEQLVSNAVAGSVTAAAAAAAAAGCCCIIPTWGMIIPIAREDSTSASLNEHSDVTDPQISTSLIRAGGGIVCLLISIFGGRSLSTMGSCYYF